MDQFRIGGAANKFYVERYDHTEWTRVTPYFNTRSKCQEFIDGLTLPKSNQRISKKVSILKGGFSAIHNLR